MFFKRLDCSCNKHGSVREDCNQEDGRCECKPNVFGAKCNECPSDQELTPDGCKPGKFKQTKRFRLEKTSYLFRFTLKQSRRIKAIKSVCARNSTVTIRARTARSKETSRSAFAIPSTVSAMTNESVARMAKRTLHIAIF